jgi:hypothetical protein
MGDAPITNRHRNLSKSGLAKFNVQTQGRILPVNHVSNEGKEISHDRAGSDLFGCQPFDVGSG